MKAFLAIVAIVAALAGIGAVDSALTPRPVPRGMGEGVAGCLVRCAAGDQVTAWHAGPAPASSASGGVHLGHVPHPYVVRWLFRRHRLVPWWMRQRNG